MSNSLRYSILDLAPIIQGGTAAQSFRNSLDLAQHAEKWGYNRYWLAEHHNSPGVASSATSLLISHVAAGTNTIRVGSGGIMLPNHSSLVIAEQFGTLESLYPGRIDLGLGRAPGTDHNARRALQPGVEAFSQNFPTQIQELMAYFDASGKGLDGVHAIPGEGLHIPIWLLGSSIFSAQLSAQLGLPYVFASHISPDELLPALKIYHSNFSPSRTLDKPYVMVAVSGAAAGTDEEASDLFSSTLQMYLGFIRGTRDNQLKPPANMDSIWTRIEKEMVQSKIKYSVVGNKATISRKISEIVKLTAADEIIVLGQIFDHAARLRSYEIFAEAINGM